ncbi:hypothetical protein ACJX0J_030061 [Zea mays]
MYLLLSLSEAVILILFLLDKFAKENVEGMHALTVLPVSLASVIRAFPEEEDKKKAEFGDGNFDDRKEKKEENISMASDQKGVSKREDQFVIVLEQGNEETSLVYEHPKIEDIEVSILG